MWTPSTRSPVSVWWTDVEARTGARGHDRRVVDDVGSRDLHERAVAGPGNRARRERLEREARRPGYCGAGGAEVRRALEVDGRLPERVLCRRGRVERHRLHAVGAADADVGELRRVVHAEVACQAGVGGVEEDKPDGRVPPAPSGAVPRCSAKRTVSWVRSTLIALSVVSLLRGRSPLS